MEHQDWKDYTWDKRNEKHKGVSKSTYMNNEMRKGNIVQQLKKGSANQNQLGVVTNSKKLLEEEDTFKHKMIGMEMGKRISQARCEKKVTQKQLANALNIQESIVKDFESGKAIYNAFILNKIEKYLNKRIRE